ncbi:MAG: hypothetical protein A3F12_05000 [Gammaproteobacteria bacterium RIFCSPHIGHO2_12_FULL_38_14]|nr:MAG: hypothetical protein A3F12_05000 [Gammaproteobacteria bacterium RIFCSPHIGHO2_12_FULL_38_14]
MKPLVCAITGANGQIGSYLVDHFRNNGYIVYELARSKEKVKDEIYYQYFDLSQPHHAPSLQNIDVLIHTACYFDTTNSNYQEINIIGTQKLFQQAKIDGVKCSIFISTISAYPSACSLYGRTKYRLEQYLANTYDNVVIVRPGLIFHTPLKGITAAIEKIVKNFSVIPMIGRGNQLIYPCSLQDLAKLILKLSIVQPSIKGPIVAAAEQAITLKELISYLAKREKKRVFFLPIPFYLVYWLLKTAEYFRLPIRLRSDNLLGLQYANQHIDFSEIKNLEMDFRALGPVID